MSDIKRPRVKTWGGVPFGKDEHERFIMNLQASENIFHLFDELPGWEDAQFEIKAACDQAVYRIRASQTDFRGFGAVDTESRNAIAEYVSNLINYGPPVLT